MERITARIALRSARPRDLSGLRETLALLPGLSAVLGGLSGGRIDPLTATLQPRQTLHEWLRKAIRDEPSAVVREGGVIAEGYDAELDELRAIQNDCGAFLLDLETRERARTGIANLRVEYNRVHGFYIEVTHAHSEKVPDDYRRRQTLKNAERYITPELKSFEDKALSAQERALAREKLLYDEVLAQLAGHIPDLRALAGAIAELHVLTTFAERSLALNLVQPTFVDDESIDIDAGRHPLDTPKRSGRTETITGQAGHTRHGKEANQQRSGTRREWTHDLKQLGHTARPLGSRDRCCRCHR